MHDKTPPPYPGTEGAPELSTSKYHLCYPDVGADEQLRNSHLVNLTPHEVVVMLDDPENYTLKIPPSGTVARVAVTMRRIGAIDGVPTVVGVYGSAEGLPAPDPTIHVNYIVSAMVRQAVPARIDLVSPADFVRDSAGKIIGCRALEINQVA